MADASEYAKAGVDYSVMEPFKQAMIAAGRQTLSFPEKRGVFVRADMTHAHGAVYEYRGAGPHLWAKTQEGLGNKNWIAEWMYERAGTGRTYYDAIAWDTALMVANDVIAQGALPVVFVDHIDASESAWYGDAKRSADLAKGFLDVCRETGMAMPAGESATLKYLVHPMAPVRSAPSLSGAVTGIIAPAQRVVTGEKLGAGDRIIGARSSGLHANGVSLVIKKALELPDQFLTKLPIPSTSSGQAATLGEEALIPTRSYVALVEALLEAGIEVHALLPGTGDGVGKIAFDHRPFTYRITSWVEVPPLFRFFREGLGVAIEDCLKTFNWGVGYYLFVPPHEAERTIAAGKAAGYELVDLGALEPGERKVIFEPEGVTLAPPGQ